MAPAPQSSAATAILAVQSGNTHSDLPTYPPAIGFGLIDRNMLVRRYRPRNCKEVCNPCQPLDNGARSFELEGLQLYSGAPDTVKEILYASGYVFLGALLHGEAAGNIVRLVIPKAEAGAYAGFARSAGFNGSITMGVQNRLVARSFIHLLDHPEDFSDQVALILQELHSICGGVELDENFSASRYDLDKLRMQTPRIRQFFGGNEHVYSPEESAGPARPPDETSIEEKRINAMVWLTQDHRILDSRLPGVNRSRQLLYSPISTCGRRSSLYARPTLLARKVNIEQTRIRLKNLAVLYSTAVEGNAFVRLDTRVASEDKFQLLAQARHGDFVMLGSAFCKDVLPVVSGRPQALPSFSAAFAQAWRQGARIMMVACGEGPEIFPLLNSWGLHTSVQTDAKINPLAIGFWRRGNGTRYTVAMNFSGEHCGQALLPLKIIAQSA
jgi:hypothetical protein